MERTAEIITSAVLLIAFSCFALIGLDVWRCISERTTQLREMSAATTNLANAMQIDAQNAFDGASLALTGIVERIETDGTSPDALLRVQRLMKLQMRQLAPLDGLFVLDRDGNSLASSQAPTLPNPSNGDRAYFLRQKRAPDAGVLIGRPVTSRSTGHLVVPVTRAIRAADGSFNGLAVATLRVDYFNRFYDLLDIGKYGAVALASTDGYLIARRPFSEAFVGKSLAGSQLLETAREYGTNVTRYVRSAQDGVVRLNSTRSVAHYPLFVSAALSKDENLASWRSNTIIHVICDLGFVALLGLLGTQLVRRIKEVARTETELMRAHAALERLNGELKGLAWTDGLTGLSNRRQFDVMLHAAFTDPATGAASDVLVSLLLIDIDFFKNYNDVYGHQAGDTCLRRVAETINDCDAPAGSVAARYGGEEMALVLPAVTAAEARRLAERIRLAVVALALPNRGTSRGLLTVSIGVATSRSGDLVHDLVARADTALYAAKSAGRDTVHGPE